MIRVRNRLIALLIFSVIFFGTFNLVYGQGDSPACAPSYCEKLKTQIEQMCVQNNWGVGQTVIVFDENGKACSCTCQPGS